MDEIKINVAKVTSTGNPFDSDILEHLSTTTPFSPDMFSTKSKKTSSQESFRWSIEQMATLHPADIDESEISVAESPDSVLEARANKAIEKFWSSQQFIVPSPDTNVGKSSMCSSDCSRLQEPQSKSRFNEPRSANRNKRYEESPLVRSGFRSTIFFRRHKETQTLLTFPPSLDLVKLLGGGFQYDEIDGGAEEAAFEANLSINTLRRKLFTEDTDGSCSNKESESRSKRNPLQSISNSPPCNNNGFSLKDTDLLHKSSSDVSLKSLDDSMSVEESIGSDSAEFSPAGFRTPCRCLRRMPSPDVSPIKPEF